MGTKGQVNTLLKPNTYAGKAYYKIIDFLDCIHQRDEERLLAQQGLTKLMINYRPKKPRLHDVSIPQYVIGAIRIMHTLTETNQSSWVVGIKECMAYIIKIMELALKFEWRSVLDYDDAFRQLQAFYGVLWVHESHCLHSVKLEPLPSSFGY